MSKPTYHAIGQAFAEVLREDPTFRNRHFRWHVAANIILVRAQEIDDRPRRFDEFGHMADECKFNGEPLDASKD